jgi:hypothetical protein
MHKQPDCKRRFPMRMNDLHRVPVASNCTVGWRALDSNQVSIGQKLSHKVIDG